MSSRLDPQIAQLLAHVPPYPGARALPLEQLREFIRQTSEATPTYPAKLAKVEDIEITGGDGDPLKLRLYRPEGQGPFPVTLYFHGGGFVMGDLDSQDMIARALAEAAGSLVVSVDYRLAPEHRYPAAPRDSSAALEWVVKSIAEYGGDPTRLAAAGDSAGGVLAAVCAVQARDKGIAMRAQVHMYGSGGYPFERHPSWHEFQDGTLLNVDDIDYFWELYLPEVPGVAYQPYAGPRFADLRQTAPAYVLTAELDPTRDDGEDLGHRIQASGGRVVFDRVPGAIHGFLSFLGAVDISAAAIERMGAWMRQEFQ
jgi:acetyl esterase